MSATLLSLAAIGLLVPALFHAHLTIHHTQANERSLSLEIAAVLIAVYGLMLLFCLRTHKHLYAGQIPVDSHDEKQVSDLEEHGPWSIRTSIAVLVAATAVVAVLSELLVGAIDEARAAVGFSEVFVGVIVVAIVGNAAEHSSAILVAMKNRMELSFQIAVGSAIQIALFVAPALVFISCLPGFPRLDLTFSMLEVAAVIVSVVVVGLVAYDGESNWLEGLLLLAVYVVLGIAFYHLPEPAHAAAGAVP
jgi:Ca2+:H+ antiporter